MGTEFGLYHLSSKTFIWLGKVVSGKQYQTPDRAIVAFMAGQQAGEFRIVPDSCSLPEDKEKGWIETGNYPWPDDDEENHDTSDGLVAFYPPLPKPFIGEIWAYSRALTASRIRQLYLALEIQSRSEDEGQERSDEG